MRGGWLEFARRARDCQHRFLGAHSALKSSVAAVP
jgi:hypothetical protein